VFGLVLAALIGWLPAVPPAHVHHSDDAGHHAVVVHRHASPHTGTHHSNSATRGVDGDDDPVVTLDTVFTRPAAPSLRIPAAAVTTFALEPPALGAIHRTPPLVELAIHGPPRAPASLRAPPRLSVL
jgi:hypothetical protein